MNHVAFKTMRKYSQIIFFIMLATVFAGCQTLYSSAVTTTEVIDLAMKDWSDLSVAGKTSKEIDAKVMAAHLRYQQACAVARDSLMAYKIGGDQATYLKAFEATRMAMVAVLDLIYPLLTPHEVTTIKAKAGKVTKP